MEQTLKQIAEYFKIFKITCYYVGGCIRDEMMGIPSEDIDICLVGASSADQVTYIFEDLIRMNIVNTVAPEVGKKFPVWICDINGNKVDFALARTEKLVGDKRTDFAVEIKGVTIVEDLERRDITMNAMAKDVLTGEIIDPFHGFIDWVCGLADPVSDAFGDDTLRVYRAARFCAKFKLKPSQKLIRTCRLLSPTDISNERVGMELMKVFKQCDKPSVFFKVLRQFGWLQYHFKELADTIGVPQDPGHHPEGDVFTHTMHTIDQAKDWFTRAVMMCHDLGKATTTTVDGITWQNNMYHCDISLIKAHGHDEAGIPLTDALLKRIHFCDHHTINQVKTLVGMHMIRRQATDSRRAVRKILRKLMFMDLTFESLVEVVRCDVSGRPPLPAHTPDIGQEIAKELLSEVGNNPPAMQPIVSGKKLIDIGLKQGPEVGMLIKKALELQDEGVLTEDNWMDVLNINNN